MRKISRFTLLLHLLDRVINTILFYFNKSFILSPNRSRRNNVFPYRKRAKKEKRKRIIIRKKIKKEASYLQENLENVTRAFMR